MDYFLRLFPIKDSAKQRSMWRGPVPHSDVESVMEEVLRTTDLVKLSYACHLLDENGVDYFVADQFISAMEGGIGAFPRRLLVPSDIAARARHILAELASDGAFGATERD